MTFMELLNSRFEKLDYMYEEGLLTDDNYIELWHKLLETADNHQCYLENAAAKIPLAKPVPDIDGFG